jgi:hypothetical protein
MASREPELSPLTVLELRYLRKAIRYRLTKRESPPSGYNTGTIPEERRHELDEIADWFLQADR